VFECSSVREDPFPTVTNIKTSSRIRLLATLSTATGNAVFGSVLISPASLTPPNKQKTNEFNFDFAIQKQPRAWWWQVMA
jgi:hypothetical protein